MNPAPDILIVGAGIVGAACAEACAEAGLGVLVLDRGCVGGGTTGAGMGHLVVMDDSPAQFALTAWSRQLWQERSSELPDPVEYDPCGTLWVAADELELTEARRKADYYRERGIAVDWIGPDDMRTVEPNLRPGLAGGLRVPGDAVLYPPAAAAWLLLQATAAGATVQRHTEVQRILPEGGVVLATGDRIFAGLVLNAAGPWSPQLSANVPVRGRKGHLAITDRHPGYVRHQIIELGYLRSAHAVNADSVAFNLQPRRNGQMLIGSSRQYDAPGTEVEPAILGRMLRRAQEYLPSFGTLEAIRCWAGHRAATPDKLPLIGPQPGCERIWLATGHEGLGITTSLATGRLVADSLLQRPSPIPSEPYLPSRFPASGIAHA